VASIVPLAPQPLDRKGRYEHAHIS